MKKVPTLLTLILSLTSCMSASTPVPPLDPVTKTALPTHTFTAPAPTQTLTPPPTETVTPTPIPYTDELKAAVTADLLSCRYGPGPEYLYLFAFRKGANIRLIGRADNDWLLVENEPQRCWIHPKFVEIQGDPQTLRTMYPDGFKLIVTPYYPPTTILSAKRDGDTITVTWIEIVVSPGDYEREAMFPYLIEVWRCENGKIVFEPLVSRFPFITFADEEGCDEPSRGRVYVQEKHGYAGPAEIPWPERER